MRYEKLQEAMCRELEKLDKKYSSATGDMTMQDIELADTIYHALKSAETYHTMKEAYEDEMSGRGRRRDGMGRYVSGGMDERWSGRYPEPMSYGYRY